VSTASSYGGLVDGPDVRLDVTDGPADTLDLRVTGVAVGGDGIARESSGRVVFVTGGLPGERVAARVVSEARRHARAVAVDVVEPAPERVAPPCPFVAGGCGGCGWQHVALPAQRALKVDMVTDALRRIGGVTDPVVATGPELPASGYRTTLRGVADAAGRFALRRHHSHELVAVPGCLVAHPLVAEVLAAGRFPPGAALTVRVGARTGERLVVVDPPERGDAQADDASGGVGDTRVADTGDVGRRAAAVEVPAGVRVVSGDELAAGTRAWLHEEVAGVRLRVSARSFFQAGPDAAEALVAAVAEAAGPLAAGARFADLYGGVGLFAATLAGVAPGGGTVAGPGVRIELVEASPSSAADARVNLQALDARVVRSDVGRWHPRRMDVVVADPPRAGLGRAGVRAVAATRTPRLVLVSCDAGALGRDTALLRDAGYTLDSSTLVDVFRHTPHVEVVSRFTRRGRQG
jgi:23S rRNA (uracil1939-C5)-methyltransferase